MGRRRDAALALFVLLVTAFLAAVAGAPLTPVPVVAGAAGTLLLEWLSQRRPRAVRRYWARPTVQAAAVLGTLLVAVGSAVLLGPAVLTALASGLLTYLGLLAALTLRDRRRG